MHISFSGVISPYIYHCPWCYYLRNVKRVKIEPKEDITQEEQSRRMRGIELHEQLSQYLKGEVEEFPFVTDTIEQYKKHPLAEIEKQFYFDLDMNLLPDKPSRTDFYSIRPDAYIYQDGSLFIADWKFANSEYNTAKYYNEVEFFIALLSTTFSDIYQAHLAIHFPEEDYTLPTRSYSIQAIASLQQKYLAFTDRILNEKIHKPIPSKARCYFCDYRSSDTGGAGICEYTVQ